MANNPHQVVIIGGGFGGLYAARALKNAPVQVTLLDRRNFHLFQPLLYQVATGTLAPGDIASPLRLVLKHQKNARVLLGEALDFDVQARQVLLRDGGKIPYDTLVLSTGSEPNYFGHDEWRAIAPGLKTVEEATAMRSRILMAFESAERETDPSKVASWLTFVVVGAGPTGVELAGALAEVANKTLRDGFRHIQPSNAKILLIDAVEHALPTYPLELSLKAEKGLRRLGVVLRPNCRVTNIRPGAVVIGEGEKAETILAQTVLWTSGVRASPLGAALAKAASGVIDKGGRVLVEPDLSIPGHPELFVIGDLANPSAKEKQIVPGVAPAAMQEGLYVAELIENRFKGKPLPPFRYRDRGSMATIGRNKAVADLGWLRFDGFPAWLAWAFVHIFKLLEFENRLIVMLQWAWYYISWRRTDLLITASAIPTHPTKETAKKIVSIPSDKIKCDT
jgi:NADH dehydrogenase